jgi:hypothetical protein
VAEAPEPAKDHVTAARPSNISEAIPSPPSPELFSVAGRDTEQAYRPLSVLALVSFGLAALYALVMVVGGAIALGTRQPFLLPAWWWILPVAFILVGWVARNQIESSEGSLSGLALTRWAIGLPLVLGLIYGAYYAATYFAVTRQARAFAKKWLEHIQKAELEEAYWQGNPPPRSSQPDLRGALEIMHNSDQNMEGKGKANFVRFLQTAGEQTKVEFAGINNWTYEGKGYRVDLVFRIQTPTVSYETMVAVKGTTGPNFKGRQWQVIHNETGTPNRPESFTFTEEGKKLSSLTQQAAAHANRWFDEQVDTRSADARLLPVDNNTFWAPAGESREAIVSAVKKIFDPDKPTLVRPYGLNPSIIPLITQEGDTTHFAFDLQLTVQQEDKTKPPYQVEAFLKVDARNNQFEVVGIELIRARTQQSGPGPGG